MKSIVKSASTHRVVMFAIWLIYVCVIIELLARMYVVLAGEDIEAYRNFSFTRLPKVFMSDPYTQFRMRPNSKGTVLTSDFQITYEINSIGLREKEIANEKNRYRVLFLGDSFTFGEGIPIGKRFSDLVGKAFPNIETINAGFPGFGIHNLYNWYEHYGKDIKEDLLLFCILEMDIDRAVYAHLGEKDKHIISKNRALNKFSQFAFVNYIFKSSTYKKLDNYIQWLFKRSYFYSYFGVKLKIFRIARSLEKRDKEFWANARASSDFLRWIKENDFQNKYREIIAREIIQYLHQAASQRGARLFIINIDIKQMDWLSNLLEELNIPYIDISPHLKNATNILFKIDPHYNSYGNQLIGDVLTEKLQDMLPVQINNMH